MSQLRLETQAVCLTMLALVVQRTRRLNRIELTLAQFESISKDSLLMSFSHLFLDSVILLLGKIIELLRFEQ